MYVCIYIIDVLYKYMYFIYVYICIYMYIFEYICIYKRIKLKISYFLKANFRHLQNFFIAYNANWKQCCNVTILGIILL